MPKRPAPPGGGGGGEAAAVEGWRGRLDNCALSDVADAEPAAFVAVTCDRIVLPTSEVPSV